MPFTPTARVLAALLVACLTLAMPARGEVRSVDPDAAAAAKPAPSSSATPATPKPSTDVNADLAPVDNGAGAGSPPAQAAPPADASSQTYHKDDLIGAADGVFGKGAKGLAGIIEKILKDQGEPNGYIAGREAAAALVVGVRYGSGTLTHKVEGQRPVYWTGPSLGFDVGGDAAKVFVLVYNLYDSQDLYKRYPEVEGHAYFVGGLSATYLRRGDIAIIPIRLGVGVRLGANVGYMKFSEKSKLLPF